MKKVSFGKKTGKEMTKVDTIDGTLGQRKTKMGSTQKQVNGKRL